MTLFADLSSASRTGQILVVDDDPYFRRAVREALQADGHTVIETACLATTRSLLRQTRPDVVLLDGQLPDGDGLELIGASLDDPMRGAVIFISAQADLLEVAGRLRGQGVVRRVLAKPVSLQELRMYVREILVDRGRGPAPEPSAEARQALQQLQRAFAAELMGRLEEVRRGAEAFAQGQGDGLALMSLAHRLHGTAGTYGYHRASTLAGEIERAIERGGCTSETARWEVGRKIPALAEVVSELARLAFASCPALTGAGPPAVAERPSPTILLVHADPHERMELARAAEAAGFQVGRAAGESEALAWAARNAPSVVFVVGDLAPGDDALRCVRRLRALAGNEELPVVLTSPVESIARRCEAARLGVDRFEVGPLSQATFLAIARRLALEGAEPLVVLLIDDDPAFGEFVQESIASRSMRVAVITDPAQCMTALEELRPDLVLLDLLMPGLSGFDVCRMIRADPIWCEVPIVVATARLEPEVRVAVFQAGADDYLAKPVVQEELASRVRGRAARARRMREQRERDALTQLLLRRPFIERVERLVARARQAERPLSVVLIDVDRFKAVNDRHGHLVGDQVLMVVGQVLRTGTRADDPCARWGGEEFAIALPDCSPEDARRVVERILGRLREMPFPSPSGGSFTVSFSAGVACTEEGPSSVEQLIQKADERLYAAKRAGRNRVCA